MSYHNPWIYNGQPLLEQPKGYAGFVYLITDTATGKKYIGRKYFTTMRKKSKEDARRKSAESDWKKYYSSNDWIKEQIKEGRATETFRREILYLGKTKGEVNYVEVEAQFRTDCLRDPNYLNDNVSGKYFKKNVMKYPPLIL